MDRCPVEIWTQIFSYACEDGGATGCALSVTSKYIRDTSKSVRHRSVAVCGFTKIFYFYNRFKRGQTSPILYLFISDSEPSGHDAHSTTDAPHTPPRVGHTSDIQLTSMMVSDILRSNAASLLSLSIVSFCPPPPLLPPLHLPPPIPPPLPFSSHT